MAIGIILILLQMLVFVPVGDTVSIDFKGTVPKDIIYTDDRIALLTLGTEGGKIKYNVKGVSPGVISAVFVEHNGDRTMFLVIVPKPKVRD